MIARAETVMSESKPRAARFIPFSALLFGALWAWAIWSCAEHWRGNPNYSYGWIVPPLALGFGLRRFWEMRRSETSEDRSSVRDQPLLGLIALSVLFAVSVCALEFARQEIWHPEIVLWTICLLAVFGGLTVFALTSGFRFGRALFFPAAFFLTAVPWPPRFEQPLTGVLMRWVAEATAELLHWLGIEAQTSGAAIALQSGMVGITEACSGVRSLQAGIMFGLAMGEWFMLRPLRRLVLLAIAILLALLTNLGRTIALSLQAEWHGVASVAAVHDTIGNIMVTALVVGIWFAGKILGPRVSQRALVTLAEIR